MKRNLRKIVSLFLTANILFSLGQVFAVNSVSSDDGASLFENVGIHYYSKDEGSRIVTMCAYPNATIEVIVKEKERNYFYTVQFKNGDLSDANYQSEPFWEALLSQAEEQLTEANKTYLSEVLETAEDALQAYTGSNDFYDFLEDAYGSEYVNKYIDSISESPVRKVTEDLNFIVDYRSTINLKKPLSIAVAITTVIQSVVTDARVKAIAKAVGGVAAVASAILPEGTELDRYYASAEFTRDGWCGGRKWNYESHTITYDGYIGNGGTGVIDDEILNMKSNYFDYPDRIMEDAYAYWRANT